MNAMRHIAVVSGGRPDYGLLAWLLRELEDDPAIRLTVVATGMHLDQRFGRTVEQIAADGFTVVEVPVLDAEDDRLGVVRAVGRGVVGMGQVFDALKPDLVVVLGDRFEILAAAQAAMLLAVPLAHLHGGELTEAAVDDSIRHAITKMACLHFAAAPDYARRIIQMGETPERVFTVGALGVEAVHRLEPMSPAQLAEDLGAPLHDPTLLVTYHPVTLAGDDGAAGLDALLTALEHFPEARVVMTGINADSGHAALDRRLHAFAAARPGRVTLHTALGQRRYLSVMKQAAAVVGNSSSGLIEAPAAGIPTIDVGDRQKGRLRAASVLNCPESADAIATAITTALDPAFRAGIAGQALPYGGIGVAARIAAILRDAPLAGLARKRFHDLNGATP